MRRMHAGGSQSVATRASILAEQNSKKQEWNRENEADKSNSGGWLGAPVVRQNVSSVSDDWTAT